jgi:hypothetical protein
MKTMKYQLTLILALFIIFSASADTGTLESIDVSTDLVGVNFEDNQKTLVLNFSNVITEEVHSVIDIRRINDLEYKTRVMRYFGGLLVSETFQFTNIVVVIDGKRMQFKWSRANISTIVNKMCRQAEAIA